MSRYPLLLDTNSISSESESDANEWAEAIADGCVVGQLKEGLPVPEEHNEIQAIGTTDIGLRR